MDSDVGARSVTRPALSLVHELLMYRASPILHKTYLFAKEIIIRRFRALIVIQTALLLIAAALVFSLAGNQPARAQGTTLRGFFTELQALTSEGRNYEIQITPMGGKSFMVGRSKDHVGAKISSIGDDFVWFTGNGGDVSAACYPINMLSIAYNP